MCLLVVRFAFVVLVRVGVFARCPFRFALLLHFSCVCMLSFWCVLLVVLLSVFARWHVCMFACFVSNACLSTILVCVVVVLLVLVVVVRVRACCFPFG